MNEYSKHRVEGSRKNQVAARSNAWLAQYRPGLMTVKDVQAWIRERGFTVLDSYASEEEAWHKWVIQHAGFMFEVTEPFKYVGGQPLIRRIKETR